MKAASGASGESSSLSASAWGGNGALRAMLGRGFYCVRGPSVTDGLLVQANSMVEMGQTPKDPFFSCNISNDCTTFLDRFACWLHVKYVVVPSQAKRVAACY